MANCDRPFFNDIIVRLIEMFKRHSSPNLTTKNTRIFNHEEHEEHEDNFLKNLRALRGFVVKICLVSDGDVCSAAIA